MKRILLLSVLLFSCIALSAANVTVSARNEKATVVFRQLMSQTGMNFVYASDLLRDVKVTVHAKDVPLKKALSEMFKDTDIEFKIRGNDVVLKRKKKTDNPKKAPVSEKAKPTIQATKAPEPKMLEEIVVVSRLEAPSTQTVEIGAKKISASDVVNVPVLFGENDVIKALLMQPGVTEGTEGMAGMNVHGGETDQNLYMLDNVPLYHVNHFGGLFSAFNTDVIRYADFFRSSIPAKYDGRLSSFMDVRTKIGSSEGHHGSAHLGLSSGAFNISGPVCKNTTYSVALRRTWFDVLTVPIVAIINTKNDGEKIRFRYDFMDLNGKINHRFSDRASGFVSVYFGDDKLESGEKDKHYRTGEWTYNDRYDMHWGNFVAQAGFNYRLGSATTSEFTTAYTRYFTGFSMKEQWRNLDSWQTDISTLQNRTDNNINDWIFRGDFTSDVTETQKLSYGANYIRHSFLPQRTQSSYTFKDETLNSTDSTYSFHANEANVYIEDDWRISDHIHVNLGIHGSLFNIDGKTSLAYAPRFSMSYTPAENWALKGAFCRTNQFVHQLGETYLSLPTDQWIPIMGDLKPESADKISFGGYWRSADGRFAVSAEGYWKWMRNLVEYRDEYYLRPPLDMWNSQLCSGRGTSKGLDLMLQGDFGKISGHVAYSLGWADRTFAEKNDGKTFPARFDHRHTINILLNWKVSKKVQFNVAWTGHSGNRFTLLPQDYEVPDYDEGNRDYTAPLKAPVNNYQLPFYHRLDLSCMVRNSRGFWTFGLYNAYNRRNAVSIKRGERTVTELTAGGYHSYSIPVFKKVSILPILPSISYTWQF